MKKTFVGLNTHLYTFKSKDAYNNAKARFTKKNNGTITEVFVANGYAFEFKKHRIIG